MNAPVIMQFRPPLAARSGKCRQRFAAQFRSQRQQLGEINAQVEDSLLGVRVVKSFANEPLEEKKFEEGTTEYLVELRR